MLRLDRSVDPEFTAFGDDENPSLFHVLPTSARYRTAGGRPVVTLLKVVGGASNLTLDAELFVGNDRLAGLRDALGDMATGGIDESGATRAPVEFLPIHLTRILASLRLSDPEGREVARYRPVAGSALQGCSLGAFNIGCDTATADLLESALLGRGCRIDMLCDVAWMAALPPMRARLWFDSKKFWAMHARKDAEWWTRMWESPEVATEEVFGSDAAGGIEFECSVVFPDSRTNQAFLSRVRLWAWAEFHEVLVRKARRSVGLDGGERLTREDAGAFLRTVIQSVDLSFDERYVENQVIEWRARFAAALPALAGMPGSDGIAIRPEEHVLSVDLGSDSFFGGH